ncbi:MAG TPA: carboxypeptidase-like regulatory domain-containing protein [Solirubrobacterales bacterium]
MTRGRTLGLTAALCALAALFSAGSAVAATGEIHGKVTDHLGEPIAGITVCAEGLSSLVGNKCEWNTDAEGKYSIGGLQAASYRVGFHVESSPSLNYVQQWYSGKAHPEEADPVELAGGESREINAQLQTGGQIRGTVADHKTGLPIEGVGVCARLLGFLQDGEVGSCGRSNAVGEFTVKNLGTGQYRLEFQTEGHVNYVEELLPEPPGSIPLTAGGVVEVEAHLVPGIEIEGTLTEMGTGTPIVGLLAPYTTPAICALNPATQARVKCATVEESDGRYSIAGLPAGTYAVSFAVDRVAEGLDLHPDGYVRRYWQEVPSFGEATLLAGTAGMVFNEIDAVLTKGEEVFPNCEVQSACPLPPSSSETSSTGSANAPATTLPQAKPTTRLLTRRPRCKKGFRHAMKRGHVRCVEISKRHKHR